MIWVILSLSLTTGDYTVVGQYTSQHTCIKAMTDKQPPEWKAHVRQCVYVSKESLDDYRKDKKDWSKLL